MDIVGPAWGSASIHWTLHLVMNGLPLARRPRRARGDVRTPVRCPGGWRHQQAHDHRWHPGDAQPARPDAAGEQRPPDQGT